MNKQRLRRRYFISYTGVQLPLKLVNKLDRKGVDKRITYFTGYYDDNECLKIIEKVVYGEIEFSHHYEYGEDGILIKAIMIENDELPRSLMFNKLGEPIEVDYLS